MNDEIRQGTGSQGYPVTESVNAMPGSQPGDKLIHEVFEHQVERTPAAIALVSSQGALSFTELNERANQLARCLRERDIGPDRLVGLCCERSPDLVISLLAILKAGGGYLPLDPAYPAERLAFMIEDAKPSVLLTQRTLQAQFRDAAIESIAVDQEWIRLSRYPARNLDASETGERNARLAYVIYTSGSTGRPKGVMIEHHAVVNFWQALEPLYDAAAQCQRVALNASFNFDASVQQLVQLLSGRTLVLVPEQVRRDVARLQIFLAQHDVHGIDCTPSQLRAWLAEGMFDSGACPLCLVLVGGEAIDAELWGRLAQYRAVTFFNVYGPTECTVDATAAHINTARLTPHIGRPMAHRCVYIVDPRGKPVPVGAAGEILIGGVCVARGYLNRPQLTAERFVPDWFTDARGARLYKTGDLGRWCADGTIEYLGRNDQQIKIRGFRVELGEIEATLARHPHIGAAVVMAIENSPGDQRLVAYFTARGAVVPSVADLRSHLRSTLPDYMVPSAFMRLERLPLMPSGKVDRHALPSPDLAAYARKPYEAPQNEIEHILADLWQELLAVEQVGRRDNFFELGGHSLLIVTLLERLRARGLHADSSRIFASASLADLASALSRQEDSQGALPPNLIPPGCERITPQLLPLVELLPEHITWIEQSVPGGAANIQDIYPLAPLQEGIVFHQLLSQQSAGTYVVRTLLSVTSRERLQELIEALQAVIDRHDILRTAVLWEHLPKPVQVVYRRARLPVEEVALDARRDANVQLKEWLEPGRQYLDLRAAPLMRLQVARHPSSEEWYALLQVHHITSDHVTLEFVTGEIVAHLQGRERELPSPLPYRMHVGRILEQARRRDSEAFFRRKLADIDEPTAPFGLVDVHGDGSQVLECVEQLDAAVAQKVRAQARRLGVSVATLFHAGWSLVVALTSGRDDVVFGSVMLGRLQGSADARRVLGMFINTLPLRLSLGELTAQQLVELTQRELAELLDHEQASLAMAQRCSGLAAASPLFSTLFNFAHNASDPQLQWSDAAGVKLLVYQERTNYPITVSVEDQGDAFTLIVQSDRHIAPQRIAGYLSTAIQSLVSALDGAPETLALRLAVLPEREQREVVPAIVAADPFADGALIHELFEKQAVRTPQAVAVTCEGQSLTYEELNRKADELARHLCQHGVGPDQLVALCVERSLHLVVGLVGILKAGGAYVPLDPNYPADRLAYMLADAQPRVVVTQQHLRDLLPAVDVKVLIVDDHSLSPASADAHAEWRPRNLRPNHLAYVMYTSGSTGKPKGVMVEHRNVTRLFSATDAWFHFNARDVWTLFHSFAFDFSVWELWGALLYGGRVVVVPYLTARSARDFYRLLCDQQVTVLNQTPSAFAQLIEAQSDDDRRHHALRYVIFGGEALELHSLRPWVERNGADQPLLVNMYGITETTVHVTYRPLTRADIEAGQGSPIGRPIPDLRVYLLNRHMQPVPVGVRGEMYVAGGGVARGYLNRPELTLERFVVDPFEAGASRHIYKSGDLARWRTDGTLEYQGRNDEQVKIRGYRIELGEIEAQLLRHPQVKQAAVLARRDVPGQTSLVAYVVSHDASATPVAESLRNHLKAALPEFMVPGAFVTLECLPLTANGKLDRRALPPPQAAAGVSREYRPPMGEIEALLAGIWSDLLRIERVSRDDDFFALGGHSILAMQVLARAGAWLSTELPMKVLFQFPTLKELAAELEGIRRTRVQAALVESRHEVDELLDQVASMSESQVQQLLQELRSEGRW